MAGMEIEQKVIVQPAGRSEADWSAAPRSSTGLPEFVDGEFKRMIELREEPVSGAEAEVDPTGEESDVEVATATEPPAEGSSAEEVVDEPAGSLAAELQSHMTALLEAGGHARSRHAAAADSSGLIKRIANRLPGS